MIDTITYSLMVVLGCLIASRSDFCIRTASVVGAFYLVDMIISVALAPLWNAQTVIFLFGIFAIMHLAAIRILLLYGDRGRLIQSVILSLFVALFSISAIGCVLNISPVTDNYTFIWRSLMASHVVFILTGTVYDRVINLVRSWRAGLVGRNKNSNPRHQICGG